MTWCAAGGTASRCAPLASPCAGHPLTLPAARRARSRSLQAATASILIDLPVVVEASQQSAGGVLFVGVAAQAGTRAGRIIRVLRVVRLLRIVRLVKMWKVRRAQTAKIESLRRRAKRRRSALLASAVSGASASVAESVLRSVRMELARTQSMAAEQSAKYRSSAVIAPAPVGLGGTRNRLLDQPQRLPTMGESAGELDLEDGEAPRTGTAGFSVNPHAAERQGLVVTPSTPQSPPPTWTVAPRSLQLNESEQDGPVFVNSNAPRTWHNDGRDTGGSSGQLAAVSAALRKRGERKKRRGTLVSLSLAKSIKNMRDKLHRVKVADQESCVTRSRPLVLAAAFAVGHVVVLTLGMRARRAGRCRTRASRLGACRR